MALIDTMTCALRNVYYLGGIDMEVYLEHVQGSRQVKPRYYWSTEEWQTPLEGRRLYSSGEISMIFEN